MSNTPYLDDYCREYPDVAYAVAFAKEAHAGQKYGDGDYFEDHVARVAERVAAGGWTESAVIVALLHDVVEDTEVTLQEINDTFGMGVYLGVRDMTHDDDRSYMNYLMDIQNWTAIVTKCADMTENLSNNPSEKNRMKYEMGLDYLRREHPRYT
jgi:(p)ppGpp synthase/HD superfamily hydrolase